MHVFRSIKNVVSAFGRFLHSWLLWDDLSNPSQTCTFVWWLFFFHGKRRAYLNRKSQAHSVWLTNECYISWKFKQDTWANIAWVPIDIPVGRQAENVTYIAFCMHENIVRIPFMARKTTTKPNKTNKKKPLEKLVSSLQKWHQIAQSAFI